MLKEDLAKFNYDLREGSLVAVAAKIYGCGVSDLLSWSEKDDGSVVIIAPTGQKFTYSADEIMKKILEPTGLECGGTGAVIRTGAELVTPIASDSQTPDPGDAHDTKGDEEMVSSVATAGADDVTKSEGEMVTDAAAVVAKDVAKSPAKRRSTRSRAKKAPSAGTGDPDK
jgi:hypothetical protein